MKRRNQLYQVIFPVFLLISTMCGAVGELYKVNPILGQSTWTIVKNIGTISDEVTPTPLFNSDVIGGVLTISASGNYQLVEDLTNCSIIITNNRVSLDLKKHTVTCASGNAIVINGTTQVCIFNGVVHGNVSGTGLLVNAGSSNVTLQDLTISGCLMGVQLAGVSALSQVKECRLTGLNLVANSIGMYCTFAASNIIKNCNALYCTTSGFELLNSDVNCFYDCSALKSTGAATVAGFKSTNGTSNMFQRCVTKQTKTSSTTFGDKACGFLLTGSEAKTKVIDCIVNETDVVSTQTALTYGIHSAPIFAWSGYVPGFPVANTAQFTGALSTPKWSPDSKYVLATYKDSSNLYGTNIASWNGSSLTFLTASFIGTSATLSASDVAWSPDGKYHVTSTYDAVTFLGNTGLYAYSFDGTKDTALGSTLPTLTTINLSTVRFSPNGKYIATGGWTNGTGRTYLSIWSFNPAASPALVDLGDTNQGGVGAWQSISWSPDGQYIASVILNAIVVYSVSSSGAISAAAVSSYTLTGAVSVAWSPCGKYIAAGDSTGNVTLLTFDGTSTLKFVAQAAGLSTNYILGLDWSPDGQYILAPGSDPAATNRVRILQYNGTPTLAVVATSTTDATRMIGGSWSADGKYIIAMDIPVAGFVMDIHMFNAMYGPSTCLISNCDICDTQATNFNMGRGMVAGGSNVFLSNIGSNNGINYSYGIPNVYDGRFEILRNVVQPFDNISMPTTL